MDRMGATRRVNSSNLLNDPTAGETNKTQQRNLQHGNLHSIKKLAQKFAKKMGGASAHFKKTIKDSAMLASIRGEKRVNLDDIGGSESESDTLSYSNSYAKVKSNSNSNSEDINYGPPPPNYIPEPPDLSSSDLSISDPEPSAPAYLPHPPAKPGQSAQAFLIIKQAINAFSDNHLESDGVFRLAANQREINTVVETLAKQGNKANLSKALSPNADKNLLPNLIKRYLNAIPGGLILDPIRDELMVSVENKDNISIKSSLKKMAPESHALLKEITDLLGKIVDHTKTNQMTYSNLGIAMGNSLFNPDIPPKDIMKLMTALPKVIEYIAENRSQLFD